MSFRTILEKQVFAGGAAVEPVAKLDLPAATPGAIAVVSDDFEAPLRVSVGGWNAILLANYSQIGPFVYDNVLADTLGTPVKLLGSVASNPQRTDRPQLRAGSILGVVVTINAAVNAGSATLEVTKKSPTGSPVATGLIATLSTSNPRAAKAVSARDAIRFDELDSLGVTLKTSNDFSPHGSADVTVEILALLDHTDAI
jgi:hypothetical protein